MRRMRGVIDGRVGRPVWERAYGGEMDGVLVRQRDPVESEGRQLLLPPLQLQFRLTTVFLVARVHVCESRGVLFCLRRLVSLVRDGPLIELGVFLSHVLHLADL